MKEDFLHYLWKFRLFTKPLITDEGEEVQIIRPGEHNNDSGPDFFNAKIKIRKTTWAGNVEIHCNASDWLHHGHQHDPAFQNIILHVVYSSDVNLKNMSGNKIPVVEIKDKFNPLVYNNYRNLISNSDWVPCAKMIPQVDSFTVEGWLERMVVERLEEKTFYVQQLLDLNKNNWEETFYQCLARNFGFKLNAVPFELLAKSLPLNILARQKNNLFQLESLLFGQAGLLSEKSKDEYLQSLSDEYAFLKKKYGLLPVEKQLWKFAKTRPVNFPTIRIAQFAMLVKNSSHLLSKIIEAKTLNQLHKLFEAGTSEYWISHYRFGNAGRKSEKKLGDSSIASIVINTIVPILFLYAREHDNEELKQRAFKFLEQLAPEKNHITTGWEKNGIGNKSAFISQGLIQLKNHYCDYKKCLFCTIGNKILNRTR